MTDNLRTDAGKKTFATLRQIAKDKGKVEKTVLQLYALERFMQRIFACDHADRFVLKGGLTLCYAEGVEPIDARGTQDIDITLPGFSGSMDEFKAILQEALGMVPADDDGSRFDVANLQIKQQREGAIAGGKVKVPFHLGGLLLSVNCDVTFDDRAKDYKDWPMDDFPSVIPGAPAVRLRKTPFSHLVADKVHAFVRHGPVNYRLKDYYDTWLVLSRGKADLVETVEMIGRTFALYGHDLPASCDDIPALSDREAERRAETWQVDKGSRQYAVVDPGFPEMVRVIREHVEPLLAALRPTPGLAA